MFGQLQNKFNKIFKTVKGHGKISEKKSYERTNVFIFIARFTLKDGMMLEKQSFKKSQKSSNSK